MSSHMTVAAVLLAVVNGQRAMRHEPVLRSVPRIAVCDESSSPPECVRRHGLRTNFAGVITCWGTSSPGRMVQAWLRSPPHRAIMLDPRYRVAGAYVGHDFGRVVFGSASE